MARERYRGERGQGIVEFAVIFPLFAALLFMIIDGGLLLGRYNNVNNSAKEGARQGSVGASLGAIIVRVQEQAHGELDDATTDCALFDSYDGDAICVQWVSGPTGETPGTIGSSVRVKVKEQYEFLTPLPNFGSGWDDIDVTVCAIQRLEQSFGAVSAANAVEGESSC